MATNNEQAELVAENVRLVMENKKLAARVKVSEAKIAELDKLVREYRKLRLKGFKRREDINEILHAVFVGALLTVAAQVVSYGIWELWLFVQGIRI